MKVKLLIMVILLLPFGLIQGQSPTKEVKATINYFSDMWPNDAWIQVNVVEGIDKEKNLEISVPTKNNKIIYMDILEKHAMDRIKSTYKQFQHIEYLITYKIEESRKELIHIKLIK